MEPLQPIPQCIDCLKSLAKTAATLAASDNNHLVEQAESISRKILQEAKDNELSSPQIANQILREIRKITGVKDPYRQFKAGEMEQARKIFSGFKGHLGDGLRSRVSVAALGNSLDFFKNPEQALADVPIQLNDGISFFKDDVHRMEKFLEKRPDTVLYLTDNAGEIYFDRPLYEYIRQHCRHTILVVKGGPSLNDLTRAELRLANLEDKFDTVADTGTDGAGIDWIYISKEFKERVESADLILSKGMANFETLYPRELKPACFFLFKVKCVPIQNYVQAPANSYVALWKAGNCG